MHATSKYFILNVFCCLSVFYSGDEMRMTSNEVTVHNNTETYVQYRNDEQRYCDLETA